MATSFPGPNDVFNEPSSPGSTALSSPGTGSRNHVNHHRDLGDAIEAMQAEATRLVHSHDGSTARHGSKLPQTSTHQSPDTDTLTSALHHTIGSGSNQVASGDHVHLHPTTLYFTSGTTAFVKASYPGLYAVDVECVGGGGGSGGVSATDSSHVNVGPGGGGGAYAQASILASDLSSSETITVGSGGAGGTSGGNGAAGGASSFGAFLIAGGGGGGVSTLCAVSSSTSQFSSGTAGTSSGSATGAIKIDGESETILVVNGTITQGDGLCGSASGGAYGILLEFGSSIPWRADIISSVDPAAGRAVGGGASGTAITVSSAAKNGAAGAVGLVIVRLIF